MKNIYDILVNFKKIPYEFYEWNKEDDVKHVKKMPSIKVSDSALYDIFYNDAVVSKNFLEEIIEGDLESGKVKKVITRFRNL